MRVQLWPSPIATFRIGCLVLAASLAGPALHVTAAPAQVPPPPPKRPAMILDQANNAPWKNGWTNLGNDVRQSFVPSLPKIAAVEVDLIVGNPGPMEDTLTLQLLDALGRCLEVATRIVPTTDSAQVLFVFPHGGVQVAPGQSYSIKLSGGITFGWKYVEEGYAKGSASVNGQPLLPGARSTFLFKTYGEK